jgi:membrane protein implicated in regulation of membrane protease activity
MELKNALGSSGTVYITIPPARQEQGKVNLMLDGQYVELSAVTDNQTPIPTGTQVTVVGISGHSTLVVKCK